jgi:hypothetical protein
MLASFSVVLSRVGIGLAKVQSPIEGIVPKCLKLFTVLEVNSESGQVRSKSLIRKKYKHVIIAMMGTEIVPKKSVTF